MCFVGVIGCRSIYKSSEKVQHFPAEIYSGKAQVFQKLQCLSNVYNLMGIVMFCICVCLVSVVVLLLLVHLVVDCDLPQEQTLHLSSQEDLGLGR